MTHLRSELAKKKQRIAELEHDVGATDTHRRQVQMHNFELEGQLAQVQQILQVNNLNIDCKTDLKAVGPQLYITVIDSQVQTHNFGAGRVAGPNAIDASGK